MIEKLDDYLLKSIQKIVDQIHDVFGITKFRLAIWLVISSAASLNLYCIVEGYFDLWDIIMCLTYLLIAFLYCLLAEHHEREFLRSNKLRINITSGVPSWERIFFAIMFLLSCAIVTLGNQSLFLTIWLLSTTLWLYVDLCVPRKPNKSKVSKWIDGIFTSLGEMLEPTHDFAPTRHN